MKSDIFKGQFIGLYDDNGKPVHEGSRVRFQNDSQPGKTYDGVVEYHPPAFKFRGDDYGNLQALECNECVNGRWYFIVLPAHAEEARR